MKASMSVRLLRTKLHRLFVFTVLLWLALTFAATASGAAPPRSVTLVYFRGEFTAEGALLEWQTATELNTAGFRIERSTAADGPFSQLNEIGIVPAQGGATSGATYAVTDTTATAGQTLWYRLVEIEFNNSEHELETISLTSGATPTATLEGIATDESDDGDDTPVPTSSAATNTPPASPTATSGAPTNTPSAPGANPTATVSDTGTTRPTFTPGATIERSTVVSPVGGGGISNAAEPTAVTGATALAQATGGYPGPVPTGATGAEGYPGGDILATPSIAAPAGSSPAGAPVSGTSFPNAGNGRTVGAGNGAGQSGEDQDEQSANLGRILLWVGFTVALLVFIAGAFFSIILSTRKQRHDAP